MASKDVNEVVAENLRYHMNQKRESESSLARSSGVAQTTIGVYLNPERRKVSASGKLPSGKVSELALLSDALGIHVWELLIDAPEQSRQMIRDMVLVMTKPSETPPQSMDPASKAAPKKLPPSDSRTQRKAVNH